MMSATTGRALDRAGHIGQSIADILTTPIGSRVMRRNYGSFIPELIDAPATPANRLRLIAAGAQAIMKWEPRTTVRRITLATAVDGTFRLDIERVDRNQVTTTRQTVSVGGLAA
jgi:phage baseplate assembly protein W